MLKRTSWIQRMSYILQVSVTLAIICRPNHFPNRPYATTQASRLPDSPTFTLVHAQVTARLPRCHFPVPLLYDTSNMSSNTDPPKTSLFSNLGSGSTSTPQPYTDGQFSNVNTFQTQQQPSLFSNLGGAPKPQSSSSPFAGLLSSQSKPQSSSNPFAGLLSSQPQTASGTGGLFGASTTNTSQPQATSLFASQNNPTSQPLQSSLFASQPLQQQQNHAVQPQQQQQDGQQSYGPTGAPQPAYFDSLLERGRKRTNGVDGRDGFGELPSLQLGLGDISRRVRELGGAGGAGGQAKQARGRDAKT